MGTIAASHLASAKPEPRRPCPSGLASCGPQLPASRRSSFRAMMNRRRWTRQPSRLKRVLKRTFRRIGIRDRLPAAIAAACPSRAKLPGTRCSRICGVATGCGQTCADPGTGSTTASLEGHGVDACRQGYRIRNFRKVHEFIRADNSSRISEALGPEEWFYNIPKSAMPRKDRKC